ncbi:hypothetical protein AK830_g4290 [Neonectria ditissima]|uniref:Uncharacterized protein n=1 Tax=Neonectria ditissima TaxID=78410 RepID=A0A0P7BLN4_9HYPO|nr:hypothetical protein AK830_g4290 [Neonectria ditissima]
MAEPHTPEVAREDREVPGEDLVFAEGQLSKMKDDILAVLFRGLREMFDHLRPPSSPQSQDRDCQFTLAEACRSKDCLDFFNSSMKIHALVLALVVQRLRSAKQNLIAQSKLADTSVDDPEGSAAIDASQQADSQQNHAIQQGSPEQETQASRAAQPVNGSSNQDTLMADGDPLMVNPEVLRMLQALIDDDKIQPGESPLTPDQDTSAPMMDEQPAARLASDAATAASEVPSAQPALPTVTPPQGQEHESCSPEPKDQRSGSLSSQPANGCQVDENENEHTSVVHGSQPANGPSNQVTLMADGGAAPFDVEAARMLEPGPGEYGYLAWRHLLTPEPELRTLITAPRDREHEDTSSTDGSQPATPANGQLVQSPTARPEQEHTQSPQPVDQPSPDGQDGLTADVGRKRKASEDLPGTAPKKNTE